MPATSHHSTRTHTHVERQCFNGASSHGDIVKYSTKVINSKHIIQIPSLAPAHNKSSESVTAVLTIAVHPQTSPPLHSPATLPVSHSHYNNEKINSANVHAHY